MLHADTTTVVTAPEPTLGAALRSLASAQLPERFYQTLQLAAPAAAQFWVWGWRRSAAWMVVASAFGIWALCQQSLRRRSAWASVVGDGAPWKRVSLVVVRRIAGLTAGLLAGGLLAERFLHLMSFLFRCPGCAG